MRDILDDYIESNIRIGEIGASVIVTGIIAKILDASGMTDRITSAFDWFVIIASLMCLSYFTAGSIHDWYTNRKEKHYVTVPRSVRNRGDVA